MLVRKFFFAVCAATLIATRGDGRPMPAANTAADSGESIARHAAEARLLADGRKIGSKLGLEQPWRNTPWSDAPALFRTPSYDYEYRGDGQFTDIGDRAAYDRYVLDLGAVRFDIAGRYEYQCAGFPPISFTFGFGIRTSDPKGDLWGTTPIRARIRLRVVRAEGDVVIDCEDRVDNWTWSTTVKPQLLFVYQRGQEKAVITADGIKQEFAVGVRTDEGWGSYFTPRDGQAYRVIVEVLEPDPKAAEFEIQLKATGGGWKS
jgi:hypothetical protein